LVKQPETERSGGIL